MTLGFTAALGLFFVLAGISINAIGTAGTALAVFVVFYVTRPLATWWWYQRKHAEARCD